MVASSGRTSMGSSAGTICGTPCSTHSRTVAGSRSSRDRRRPIRMRTSRAGSAPRSTRHDCWLPSGSDRMAELELVLGGTRSGKSRFALARASALGGDRVTFVATARAGDEELDARIADHRRARPAAWRTVEVDGDLAAAVASADPAHVVLLDSLTLWLSADRKSTRLNSSHGSISYAVFCLKKKKK